jgi:hypothetical protein
MGTTGSADEPRSDDRNMNADEEFEIQLPGGKTKKFRKWRDPKTSKQKKDNDAFERARKAHERNTGKESVEGSPKIARSTRSAFEEAAQEIRNRADLSEEQKRQHLMVLREQQVEATNPSASKDNLALTAKQRHRGGQRKRQRLKRKSLT